MGECEVPIPCGIDPVLGTCRAGTELSHKRTEGVRLKSIRRRGATLPWLTGAMTGVPIAEGRWRSLGSIAPAETQLDSSVFP